MLCALRSLFSDPVSYYQMDYFTLEPTSEKVPLTEGHVKAEKKPTQQKKVWFIEWLYVPDLLIEMIKCRHSAAVYE